MLAIEGSHLAEPDQITYVEQHPSLPDEKPSHSLVKWFTAHAGCKSFDDTAIDIVDIPGQGRGVIALVDLPEGYTLFTIPRDLVLSTRTSDLPRRFGAHKWRECQLDKGWAGLILCMMWEEALGSQSRWDGYLESLPTEFDTPIFWNEADLEELRGSFVLDKIGKADAENDYRKKILPAIRSRAPLFPDYLLRHYTLQRYHIMGSRILSRSFSLGEPDVGEEKNINDEDSPTAMDVDETPPDSSHTQPSRLRTEDDDDSNERLEAEEVSEDDDDDSDVAMVPLADMLNARHGANNAKLFHEPEALKMITTKPIPKGEQIYNTYGNLPNSELLRRYGYVDLLRLPDGMEEGNPADEAEIRADLVVDVVSRVLKARGEWYKERIDWYLEEGGDDVLVLDFEVELPDAMISLVRLLMMPTDEWTKARGKGKVPKPTLDDAVLRIVQEVLEKRLAMYPTSITEDEDLLNNAILSRNKRHAIVVRLGEKRILNNSLKSIRKNLQATKTKRKASDPEKRDSVKGHGQKKKRQS